MSTLVNWTSQLGSPKIYVIEVQQQISVFLDFCYAPVGFFFFFLGLFSYLATARSEQWTQSTRKPDRPDPNREVLGESEDIRVGFRVLFSGSGR